MFYNIRYRTPSIWFTLHTFSILCLPNATTFFSESIMLWKLRWMKKYVLYILYILSSSWNRYINYTSKDNVMPKASCHRMKKSKWSEIMFATYALFDPWRIQFGIINVSWYWYNERWEQISMQKYILIKNRTRSNSLRNVVYDPRAHKYYNNKKYCANVMYNILIIYNDVNTI